MNDDDATDCQDSGMQSFYVTVSLMEPKLHGNVETKVHRSVQSRDQTAQPSASSSFPLEQFLVDFRKLRQCSKYFDACMSTRWTSTQTPTDFYLEAHTETRFYKDCFDRMHDFASIIRPISSVTDCIELLKVASQIEFSQMLDIGVRYLASVPWSDSDEQEIRAFVDSELLSSHSTHDLRTRLLQMPEESERNNHLKKVLSRSVKLSMTGLTLESQEANRRVFEDTFNSVVRDTNSRPAPGNQAAWQIAVSVVKEELHSLWSSIKKDVHGQEIGMIIRPPALAALQLLLTNTVMFAWLYSKLQWTYSGQEVVELLVADHRTPPLLQRKFQYLKSSGLSCDHQVRSIRIAEKMLAEMMRTVFRDVLEGNLFLNASERRGLFCQWNWLMKTENFEILEDANTIAALVCRFIMTFPHEEQEEVFDRWLTGLDGPPHLQRATCDLSEVYSLWLQHLVSKVVLET